MERRDYQKPAVKIVVLMHRTCLLQTSSRDIGGNGNAGTQDYYVNDEQEI